MDQELAIRHIFSAGADVLTHLGDKSLLRLSSESETPTFDLRALLPTGHPDSPGDTYIGRALRSETQQSLPALLPSKNPRVTPSRWGWKRIIGVAALIAVAATIALVFNGQTRTPVAVLAAELDSRWALDGDPPPTVGALLKPGECRLEGGVVRIRCLGGAELIVHAPAHFTLQSSSQLRLEEGLITAEISHGTGPLRVDTPSARVIDLGTSFALVVEKSGAAELQVLEGKVRLEPESRGGIPSTWTAGTAARVEAGAKTAAPAPARLDQFAHEMPLVDLIDVVAGGDGTQGKRGRGIDVTSGLAAFTEPEAWRYTLSGDGMFRPVGQMPLVAGVFVPLGGPREQVLDPDGHTFGFPQTDGKSWHLLWGGTSLPLSNWKNERPDSPSTIGGRDYGSAGHGALWMHSNKGVAFDLGAIRSGHPDRPFTRFRAECQNVSATAPGKENFSELAAVWVFVDGELRFTRVIRRSDPAFSISVDLSSADHYLTLVSTDGGDGHHGDWITLGDPRLE